MFSYFNVRENNEPDGSFTINELYRQLVNPDREPFSSSVNIIHRLRAESDKKIQDKIKAELPAFTPGAQLDTKHKDATPDQKNIRYSGFMQIDIDLQDNPNMTNPEAIRDKLAQIPYIALSALSARGRGVWGLMALQEPEKFMQYKEQVYNYFKRARVTLDKTKGKNPTELRYFAPDSGAILNTKYELLPLEQVPAKPKQQQLTTYKASGSTLGDLQKWVTETTGYNLIDGQKHDYLYWLSYAIRKNGSSETEVYNTIHSNVLSSDQIKSNCISGGIAHANAKGLYVPQQPLYNSEVKLQELPELKPVVPHVHFTPLQAIPAQIPINENSESVKQSYFAELNKSNNSIFHKQPESWDNEIQSLVSFFNSTQLPHTPVKLDQSTVIYDLPTFISGHLAILHTYNGNTVFLPYLQRLQQLRQILES